MPEYLDQIEEDEEEVDETAKSEDEVKDESTEE